uniref:Calponin-homology (CH) domain-containing protein n=1 Tax=Gouania willdenowi TaxID=441366 RepID=A0A8C5E640_GOUWI
MSVDKAELCDSLLTWLQTFHVPSCTSKHDLISGVAIAHVLHKIDPAWFNATWLGRIKEDNGDNWRLKVSNLKKILKSMLEYYHDVLGHQLSEEHLPDVSLIGEMGDVTELGKLVQLVLGCAVSCEKKQERIQQIMTLEESVQHVVMTAIQEVSEPAFKKSDACQNVPLQGFPEPLNLSMALEEKSSLQTEMRSLKEKLNRRDSLDASAITGKKLLLLQSQMEQLQEENYRLENSRDDMRVRGEMLEREVGELQHQNETLTSLAQEAQALKDEMDILRHSSDRVNQLEALVDTYKRKLEDLGDLRRQVRLLEERNTVYMQKTCELEEELRRANAVRSQLDAYKRQVHELHNKHSAEAMKAEKWQFEYKNLHDKFDALLKEKEVSLAAMSHVSEIVSDCCLTGVCLRCVFVCRETMVRLQSENKMLCVQEETYRRELTESSLLKKKLEEHLEKLHEAHSDLQKKREVIDDLEPKVDGNMAKKIDELQEILRRKDEDMKRMEERYKRYVERARTVIKTLDPQQQPPTVMPGVQALKNQVMEKERKIQHLEHDYEKSRARHDLEEKLLITAWYNMGMVLHQKVSSERLGPSNQSMSFLAQQRQSTNARRALTRHNPR